MRLRFELCNDMYSTNLGFRNRSKELIQTAVNFKLKTDSLGEIKRITKKTKKTKKREEKCLRFKLRVSLGSTLLNVKEFAKQMKNFFIFTATAASFFNLH